MTTAAAPLHRQPRTVLLDTATRASLVLWAVLAVNVLILELLVATSGGGKNGTLTIAKFFGLHAALIMMLQLVLVARLPWLDRRIGMDRLTVWHRWVGFTLLWTVVAHLTLILLGYARLDDASVGSTFLALAGVPASLLGMLAATLIVVVAVTSARSARRRMSYERWRALHVAVYAVLALALAHQFLEGTTFRSSPLASAYWWTAWTLVILALVVGRIVIPLRRNAIHRFRVAAVQPESDDVVSVHVTGRDLDRLPARAGQFFVWRFPEHHGWWQANPFSLSAAPDGRTLRLTARAVGSTSEALRRLPAGTPVFAEGPYGAFTAVQRTRPAAVLVAGGVGVTPIRAMLEESTAPDVVLYRVRTEADAVLLGELQELAAARGGRVHLLTGRTAEGSPLTAERMRALVPDITVRDVFVCGPDPMTRAVLRELRTLGVPRRQVHSERFRLA